MHNQLLLGQTINNIIYLMPLHKHLLLTYARSCAASIVYQEQHPDHMTQNAQDFLRHVGNESEQTIRSPNLKASQDRSDTTNDFAVPL